MSGLRPSNSTLGKFAHAGSQHSLPRNLSSTSINSTSSTENIISPSTTTTTNKNGLPSRRSTTTLAYTPSASNLSTHHHHQLPNNPVPLSTTNNRSFHNNPLSRATSHISLAPTTATPTAAAPQPTATNPVVPSVAATPSTTVFIPNSSAAAAAAAIQPLQSLTPLEKKIEIYELPRRWICNHNGLVISVYEHTPVDAQKMILEYIDLFIYNVLSYGNQWYYIIAGLSLDYTCPMLNLLACDFFVATEDLPSAMQCLKRCATLLGTEYTIPSIYKVPLNNNNQQPSQQRLNLDELISIDIQQQSNHNTNNNTNHNEPLLICNLTTNQFIASNNEIIIPPTTCTRREILYYHAYSSWLSGDMPTSLGYWLTIISYYPYDIFAMKRAQLLAFLLGKQSIMINLQLIPNILQSHTINLSNVYFQTLKLLLNVYAQADVLSTTTSNTTSNDNNPTSSSLSYGSSSDSSTVGNTNGGNNKFAFWFKILHHTVHNQLMLISNNNNNNQNQQQNSQSGINPTTTTTAQSNIITYQPSLINFYQSFTKMGYFFGMLSFALEQTGSYIHSLQSGYLGTLLSLLQALIYKDLFASQKTTTTNKKNENDDDGNNNNSPLLSIDMQDKPQGFAYRYESQQQQRQSANSNNNNNNMNTIIKSNPTTTTTTSQLVLTTDPWSHHGIFHALFGLTQHAMAIKLGLALSPSWDNCMSFMFTHNWFHITLMFLELGHFVSALALLDIVLWRFAAPIQATTHNNNNNNNNNANDNTTLPTSTNLQASINNNGGASNNNNNTTTPSAIQLFDYNKFNNNNNDITSSSIDIKTNHHHLIIKNENINKQVQTLLNDSYDAQHPDLAMITKVLPQNIFFYIGNGYISQQSQTIELNTKTTTTTSSLSSPASTNYQNFTLKSPETGFYYLYNVNNSNNINNQQNGNNSNTNNDSINNNNNLRGYFYNNVDNFNLYNYYYYMPQWDVYNALNILGYNHVDAPTTPAQPIVIQQQFETDTSSSTSSPSSPLNNNNINNNNTFDNSISTPQQQQQQQISTTTSPSPSAAAASRDNPILYLYKGETLDSTLHRFNEISSTTTKPTATTNASSSSPPRENIIDPSTILDPITKQEHQHIHSMTLPVIWRQNDVNYPLTLHHHQSSVQYELAKPDNNKNNKNQNNNNNVEQDLNQQKNKQQQQQPITYDINHYNTIKNIMPRVNKNNTQDQCGAMGLLMKLELHSIIYPGLLCHEIELSCDDNNSDNNNIDIDNYINQQQEHQRQYQDNNNNTHCQLCTYNNTNHSNHKMIRLNTTTMQQTITYIDMPNANNNNKNNKNNKNIENNNNNNILIPCQNPLLILPRITALDYRYNTILQCININNPHQDPFYDLLCTYLLLRCERLNDAQYYIEQAIASVNSIQNASPQRYNDLNNNFIPFLKAFYSTFALYNYERAVEYLIPIFLKPNNNNNNQQPQQKQKQQQSSNNNNINTTKHKQTNPYINKSTRKINNNNTRRNLTKRKVVGINVIPTAKIQLQYMSNNNNNNNNGNNTNNNNSLPPLKQSSPSPSQQQQQPQQKVDIVKLLTIFNRPLTQKISTNIFQQFQPFVTIFINYLQNNIIPLNNNNNNNNNKNNNNNNNFINLSAIQQLYEIHNFIVQYQPKAHIKPIIPHHYTLDITSIACFGASNEQCDVFVDFFCIVMYLSPKYHRLLLDVIDMRLNGERDSTWLRQIKVNITTKLALQDKFNIFLENKKQTKITLQQQNNSNNNNNNQLFDTQAKL